MGSLCPVAVAVPGSLCPAARRSTGLRPVCRVEVAPPQLPIALPVAAPLCLVVRGAASVAQSLFLVRFERCPAALPGLPSPCWKPACFPRPAVPLPAAALLHLLLQVTGRPLLSVRLGPALGLPPARRLLGFERSVPFRVEVVSSFAGIFFPHGPSRSAHRDPNPTSTCCPQAPRRCGGIGLK